MRSWLTFTLLTMLLWGGWGLLSKPATNALSAWEIQTLSAIGLLPVIGALSLKRNPSGPDERRGLSLAFGAGVVGSLGNVAYYKTLAAGGKAAAVTPLTALYPIVTIALAVAFLGERLNGIQVAGALLSLLAVYCFNVGSHTAALTPWLALALVPIVLWGASALLQKMATSNASTRLATAAFLVGQLPTAVLTPMLVPITWSVSPHVWALVIALGLLFGLGNLTLIYAYGTGGKASIVTPLASLYSLVTIPLAVGLLGERLSAREGLGIGLALAAVIALSCERASPANVAAQR